MIKLHDTVYINVSPSTVWAWLETLPDHVQAWHPDHTRARWIRGGAFVPGAEMEVVERLHGTLHCLRMRLTAVTPGRRVQYRIFPGLEGSLEVRPSGSGTTFTATLQLGTQIPLLGGLIDWLLRRAIPGRLAAVHRHLQEEGENLRRLLEAPGSVDN